MLCSLENSFRFSFVNHLYICIWCVLYFKVTKKCPWAGCVFQLVEACWACSRPGLGPSLTWLSGVIKYTCSHSTREVEAGGLETVGYLQPLMCLRPALATWDPVYNSTNDNSVDDNEEMSKHSPVSQNFGHTHNGILTVLVRFYLAVV